MTRRPAVTLLEVLVSLFIMAIGMLALLALFPLGAVTMGRALQDDRVASTASMAENVAVAFDLRNDGQVSRSIILTEILNPPANPAGPGNPVFVDPYGAVQNLPPLGQVGKSIGIARVNPNFSFGTQAKIDRWFTLPDDLTYLENGTPDLSAGVVPRGRRYSFAYLLRRPQAFSAQTMQVAIVVYRDRPTDALTVEPTYTAQGAAGTRSVTLTWTAPQPAPDVRRGGWILDTTTGGNVVQAHFYRAVDPIQTGAGSMVVEVEPTLKADLNAVTVMEQVVGVFEKPLAWQPHSELVQ
jgi:hypothetical protein